MSWGAEVGGNRRASTWALGPKHREAQADLKSKSPLARPGAGTRGGTHRGAPRAWTRLADPFDVRGLSPRRSAPQTRGPLRHAPARPA